LGRVWVAKEVVGGSRKKIGGFDLRCPPTCIQLFKSDHPLGFRHPTKSGAGELRIVGLLLVLAIFAPVKKPAFIRSPATPQVMVVM
jgi:hypothetical protein